MNTKILEHFLLENYEAIDLLKEARMDEEIEAREKQKKTENEEIRRLRNLPEAKEVMELLKQANKLILKARIKIAVHGGKLRRMTMLGDTFEIVLGDNNKEKLKAKEELENTIKTERLKTIATIIKLIK